MRRLTRSTEAGRPRGMTLIELLVTIAILLAVTAVTIPLMQPNNGSSD
jgi:prepilin-type N-terminal cleavage/methylation domain-containing protein